MRNAVLDIANVQLGVNKFEELQLLLSAYCCIVRPVVVDSGTILNGDDAFEQAR